MYLEFYSHITIFDAWDDKVVNIYFCLEYVAYFRFGFLEEVFLCQSCAAYSQSGDRNLLLSMVELKA